MTDQGLSPKQLQRLRDAIAVGKIADEKLNPERAFLRGWNGGVEWVETQIKLILAESETRTERANDGATGR